MHPRFSTLLMALVVALSMHPFAGTAAEAASAPKGLSEQPAVVSPGGLKTSMLAVARAGQRLVAVGDRGVVLLSDDSGATFRQAKQVPTRAALTSVFFAADGKTGWSAGHWGVILTTKDAGDTWTLQRDDLSVDQPLFTIAFTSTQDGLAGGLWSLLLRTRDAGKTWQPAQIGKVADQGKAGGSGLNLFSLFMSAKGTLFIAAEQGTVYRSVDKGETWSLVETGNKGTFWAGIGLQSGVLLAAGLGGNVYRSIDDGVIWTAVSSATKSSITGLTQLSSGRVVGVGLDGLMLTSDDEGSSFKASYLPERTILTAVIAGAKDVPLVFSVQGPLSTAQGSR